MKCENCGQTIDANALTCPFCSEEIKPQMELTEEIEVLDDFTEVEETVEPSIISSEEISLENLDVAKPKKKKKRKKKKNDNEATSDEVIEGSAPEMEVIDEIEKENETEEVIEVPVDKIVEEKEDDVIEVPRDEYKGETEEEVIEIPVNQVDDKTRELTPAQIDKILIENDDFDVTRTLEKVEDSSPEIISEVPDNNPEIISEVPDNNPDIISSEEVSIDDVGKVENPNSEKDLVPDIIENLPTEDVNSQDTAENDETYQPFVESDTIVPLPPKKTLRFRIKDLYNSLFEGYEKAQEIKVDDREARLTLEKIYERNEDLAAMKKLSVRDIFMTWLVCFVIGFILFFLLTALSFAIDIAVGDHNNIALLKYIIPIFQILIPLILILFGWGIGMIYSYVKRKNKRRRSR